MLFTNRRHRLLYMALAGMDVAWALPYLGLFERSWQDRGVGDLGLMLDRPPLLVFATFWLVMLALMAAADLLNRSRLESPAYELTMLGLALATGLLAVRVLLYPTAAIWDLRFLANTADAVVNFANGLRPELPVLAVAVYLWVRVAMFSGRELTFFNVGMSFRFFMLLAILGNALLTEIAGAPTRIAIQLFALFFTFGLIASALARIDQKAVGSANSTGALLPWPRMTQIVVASLAVVAATLALGLVYSPALVRTVLGWLSPLWTAIRWLLSFVLFALIYLLSPILEWLARLIRGMMGDPQPQEPVEVEPFVMPESVGITEALQQYALLRYCLVTLVVAAVVGLLIIFFVRTQQRARSDEDEGYAEEEPDYGGGALRRGLDRLRALWNLARQYGLGPRLLAAISVQNIYANLQRLARQRGFPRKVSQPPDAYLPVLMLAFPGCDAPLNRITNAYMRVHYGDLPVEPPELAALRADYEEVVASTQDEVKPKQGSITTDLT